MNLEHFRPRLLEKEAELSADIARLDREVRTTGESEVRDPVDEAASAELQATSLGESSLERQTLTLVRDALRRVEHGTFGKCIACHRPIEPARLEAVPWTPYCRADQEKHDSEAAVKRS